MKHKLLTLFLALAASVGTLFAQSGTCGDNLTWNLSDGTLTITGTGSMKNYNSSSYAPWYSYITSIKTVIIEDGVTSIGERAFYNCSSLASVTIGESVTSIGDYAFKGCSKLATVIWNAKKINNYFSSSNTPFYYYNSSSIYNFDHRKHITSFTFGDNVEYIPAYLCSGMSNLTTITIPNSVTSIGNHAFSDCTGLTSVTIGESVTSIGNYAFKGCSKLATIIWNAKKINDFSSSNTPFYYYNSSSSSDYFDLRQKITSFTFGDNVEYIPAYLCSEMSNLTTITIPNSVTSIGERAFSVCSSLTSVTIGESVTSIGSSAFLNCSSLTSVHISDIAAWCKIAFYSSISNPLYYAHNLYLNGTLVTDLVIPDGVTSIKSYAFYGCSNLTSLTIPNSVTSIGGSAFYGCTYLEDITIGSGINVENGIGQNAFYGCRYLLSVTCKAVYPPAINANVFEGCGVLGGVDLNVPEKSVARYKKADVWSEFNIVGKDLSVDDPTNPTNPEDGKYTITWQDEDGNVIKTDQVAQGTTPAFTGTTPTKPATNEYTYEFAGWLPKIKAATEDTKYTTYFIPTQQQESKVYTVNINGENCSLNINNQYPEGTVITLEAVADECFEFQQWSDGNKDNPRTITVTANTNLTAEFNKVRYTVTGEPSTGGKVQIRKQ